METKEFKLKQKIVDFEVENKLVTLNFQINLKVEITEISDENPNQRVIQKTIGYDFLNWAENYYAEGTGTKLNERIPRKEIYKDFIQKYPHELKFTSPQCFRKKLIEFCQWKGYKINPRSYDPKTGFHTYFDKYGNNFLSDKSGGIEYFTVSNNCFELAQNSENNKQS